MISRREFVLGVASTLPLLYVSPAFSHNPLSVKDIEKLFPKLHCILIKKGDDIVFSAAAPKRSFERAVNIKSCSKSLLALLLGATVDSGITANLNLALKDTISHLLPKKINPKVASITIEELVTLTAPLQSTSIGNYDNWIRSKNWLRYVLTHPSFEHKRGSMIYSTGTTHTLGIVLAELAQKNLHSLFQTYLGDPMDIRFTTWTKDPQGYFLGGNEMSLSPNAMLDIATMIRDDGIYKGKQVISKKWLQASMAKHTLAHWGGLGYGYGWYLSKSGYVLARGYGGQIIAANKKKNLAIAITSNPAQPARIQGYFGELLRLLEGPILRV